MPTKPVPPARPAAKPVPKPAPKPAVHVATPTSRIVGPNFLPVKPAAPAAKTPTKPVVQPRSIPVAAKPAVGGTPVVRDHRTGTLATGHAGTAAAPAKVPPKTATTLPVKPVQATPQLNNIRFIDPGFARNIVNLRPVPGGAPREQMKVPICPVPDATDEVLFEDPAQPAKKYYLPRYKLATEQQKYLVSFRQSDAGWSFVVKLTKFAAPKIADAAKSAQEIDHHVAVLVRFSQMIGNQAGAQEELSFQEVALKDGVLTATLHLDSLSQRDLLYQALRDRTFGTVLIVRRAVTVAVLVPQLPTPMIAMAVRPGMPQPLPPAPKPAVPQYRQADRVVDAIVDPKPFVFSPDLHKYIFTGVTPESSDENLGLTRCQVAWTDGRSYTYYQDGAKPYVFYYLPDCFKLPRRQDGAHEPLVTASFGQAASAEDLKATFSFIAVPYVNPKRLEAAAPKLKESISDLPKGVTGPQFEPLLSAPGKIHFSLSYPGCDTSHGPYELRDKASVDLRAGIHDSLTLSLNQFQSLYDSLFSSSSVLLTGKVDVDLGADAGEEIPFTARLTDLAGDFLSFTEGPLTADGAAAAGAPADGSADAGGGSFKESAVSALSDAASGDVQGAVEDLVGGLAGKLFGKKKDKKDKKKKPQPAAPEQKPEPGLQVTWQNIIESPVEIKSLNAALVRGAERIEATTNLDLSEAMQIPAGQQLTFNVTPAAATAAGQPVHADFDMSGVHPLPDKEAIWNEILDPTAAGSYVTSITVKTPASTFAAPAGNPDQQIVSLVVDFDSGVSAELNSSKLEAKVDLPHPVVNYVLRKSDTGEYRYKRTLVLASGEQTRDEDWRPPETTTVLFPAVR